MALLSQEVGLRQLVFGIEKEVHETRQCTAILLEFGLQVALAGDVWNVRKYRPILSC